MAGEGCWSISAPAVQSSNALIVELVPTRASARPSLGVGSCRRALSASTRLHEVSVPQAERGGYTSPNIHALVRRPNHGAVVGQVKSLRELAHIRYRTVAPVTGRRMRICIEAQP